MLGIESMEDHCIWIISTYEIFIAILSKYQVKYLEMDFPKWNALMYYALTQQNCCEVIIGNISADTDKTFRSLGILKEADISASMLKQRID
ncbi:Hypothetical predicted protein [Octopus vulgaris]|uniref:Uncharacterized protein n=1 Tax=Octopus vulgaris TaxID=6645 RepID=A0AA36B826_OCTVU|nr:Hypothetical predicted protein [Octopus vulgaris]